MMGYKMKKNDYIEKTKAVNGCFLIFLLWLFITFIPLFMTRGELLLKKGLLFPLLYTMEFSAIFLFYILFFRKRDGMGKGTLHVSSFLTFLIAILIVQFILPHFTGQYKVEKWTTDQISFPGWALIFNSVLLVFIVPVYEEIVFRGCLFNALMYWFNDKIYWVAITVSMIFSLAHTQYVDWRSFFSLFLISMILTAARVKSKGIYLPIALHATMNGIVIFVNYTVFLK